MISFEKHNLGNLPPEMVGNILKYLTVYTGSKGILNDSDVPVIMNYAMNLARTCKQLYASINDPIVTDMFVHALSNKYGQSADHFAALFDTLGARKWLWLFMEKQGLDKAYKIIRHIQDLANNIKKEAKELDFDFVMEDEELRLPEPNFYGDKTDKGFALHFDSDSSYLSTPFGVIQLFDKRFSCDEIPLSVSEIFINRLDAVLESVSNKNKSGFFEIVASDRPHKLRKITSQMKTHITFEDVIQKKGTQNLIINYFSGTSIYKIRKVGDTTLPDLTLYQSSKTQRSWECAVSMWRMLKQQSLGKDPLEKPQSEREFEKKLVEFSRIQTKPIFKDLSDISKWAISQLKLLCRQPLSENEYKTFFYKLLESDQDLTRILQAINESSKEFLDNKLSTFVNSIELYNHQNFWGSRLILSDINKIDIDFDTLEKAYEKAVKNQVSFGWKRATLEEYPDTKCHCSEEEFDLFVKDARNSRYCLLMWLVERLGHRNHLYFSYIWKKGSTREFDFLWIKKDKLDFVFEILKLDSSLK